MTTAFLVLDGLMRLDEPVILKTADEIIFE